MKFLRVGWWRKRLWDGLFALCEWGLGRAYACLRGAVGGRRRPRRRPGLRPGVEALEVRLVPSFTFQMATAPAATEGAAFYGRAVAQFTTDGNGLQEQAAIQWGDGQSSSGLISGVGSYGVLANALDVDGDAVTAVLVHGPQHGTLALNPDGGFVYTPNPGFIGADVFTAQPFDGIQRGVEEGFRVLVRPLLVPPWVIPQGPPPFPLLPPAAPPAPPAGPPDLLPLPGGPVINIFGNIEYRRPAAANVNAVSNPVRAALVDLVFKSPVDGPITVSRTFTLDNGSYSFAIRPGVVPPNTLFVQVESQSAPPGKQPAGPFQRAVAVDDMTLHLSGVGTFSLLSPTFTPDPNGLIALLRLSGSLNMNPYRVGQAVLGNYQADTRADIGIGNGSVSEKAFWTLDAAITASRIQSTLQGVQPGWCFLTFHDFPPVDFTSFTPPGWNMPIIKVTDFDDFDTVVHEYGHFIQYTSGFFPFTIEMYAAGFTADVSGPFGAPTRHLLGQGNLRVQPQPLFGGKTNEGLYWRKRINELAFSEGWADFYSVAAQSLDPTCPSVANGNEVESSNGEGVSGDGAFHEAQAEDAPPPPPPPILLPSTQNFGEDDEVTVMRVLWDLFDPVGAAVPGADAQEVAKDRISLGLQGVFNLLAKPPGGPGSVITLSDLSQELLQVAPNARAKVDAGAIFELNNVSPTGLGVLVNGAPAAIVDPNAAPPTFVWTIPQGLRNNFITAQLLNGFTVRVFNADFSQELLNSGELSLVPGAPAAPVIVDNGLDANGLPGHPARVSWTPGLNDWAAVSAVQGEKHVVISGSLVTTLFDPYKTGEYWSDALDFVIGQLA